MKQRVLQDILAKRQAKISKLHDVTTQKLSQALSVPQIAAAHEKYVNSRFDSLTKNTETDSDVDISYENYRNALAKFGYSESDFEYSPLCKKCNDSGYFQGKVCSCVWNEYIVALKKECQIEERAPFTFADCKLNNISDENQRNLLNTVYSYMQKFANQLPHTEKTNIVFSGGVGTGKTFIVSATARATVERGKSCVFTSAYRFNSAMLACHTSPISERNRRLHDYLTSDLLVIDDLGTEPFLKNVTEEYLLLVLEERQNAHLCTLITTNLDQDNLLARYHERIYSRLTHKKNSMFLKIVGDDLRHIL